MKSVAGLAACLAACFLLGAPVLGEEKPSGDAKEVLRASIKAIQEAKVISYSLSVDAEGWVAPFVPKAQAKVVVGKPAAHDVPRFFTDATLTKTSPAEEGKEAKVETVSYQAGCDGNEYFLIDHKTKKAHHDLDPVVLGSDAQNLQRLALKEFTEKEPFKKELETEKVTLDGTETVDGVECDKVAVDFGSGMPAKVTWYIARSDRLPRRVRRFYPPRNAGETEGATVMTLTQVKVNPKLDKDPFAMTVPEGYTATDEFAP